MAYDRLAGIPNNPAFIPGFLTGFSDDMNLRQRCLNVLAYGVSAFVYNTFFLAPFERLKVKHDIRKGVSVRESFSRSELWLENGDIHIQYPRAIGPNVVLIGGITSAPAKPLPTVSLLFFIIIIYLLNSESTKRPAVL